MASLDNSKVNTYHELHFDYCVQLFTQCLHHIAFSFDNEAQLWTEYDICCVLKKKKYLCGINLLASVSDNICQLMTQHNAESQHALVLR